MASGFKIASAYVDVTLDRSALPGELEDLARELSASSDAIGKSAGKRIGDGIGKGVGDAPVAEPATRKGTEAGGRFGDAFTTRMRAALSSLPPVGVPLDDKDAQVKLDFLREELRALSDQRIGVDISEVDALAKLSYLRAQLDELRMFSPSVQIKADTAAASAEIDKFLALTEAKAEVAGKDTGDKLSKGMAANASKASPLIVSAIAGGLIAGGPVISAAGILLFGGLAAAAASNVGSVQNSFKTLGANVMNDVQRVAVGTASEFNAMAGDIQSGFDRLAPSLNAALVGVAPEIHDVVDALMGAANTAMPAFTRAIQQGQPVVRGLDALIRDLGSGVAGMMDAITAHSGAEGAVLSDLGQTINILLPTIGQLLGEGAELGQTVLPVVNTALQWTSDILHLLGPILPEVALGFAAFKVVGMLSGPLDTLSAKLQTVAADGEGMASKLSGKAASAVSGLGSALPVLGIVVGLVGAAFQQSQQTIAGWGKAIDDGGAAAERATKQAADMADGWGKLAVSTNGASNAIEPFFHLLGLGTNASDSAAASAKKLRDEMSPLEQAQQDVTRTQNDYTTAVQKYGANSGQAVGAAAALASAQEHLTGMQIQVKAATDGASAVEQTNAVRLQGLADRASAANTAISLLKGAIDSLTGANVTADQAQIAITQAVQAATTATQGQTGALVTANGQINLNSQAGASAASALMNLASTQHNEIAVLQQQGANSQQVAAQTDQLRQQFINVAQQMGFTAGQAQNLANRYFGIPGQVTTTVTGIDNSSSVINRVQSALAQLHDKTITVTTYNRIVSSGPAGLGGAATPNAAGGIMLPMAVGGVVAMASGADMFEPNNPRVLIGDNRRVRESFIPQDDSPRSKAILTETASAMGYGLTPTTGSGQTNGGPMPAGNTYNVTLNLNALDLSNGGQLSRRLLEAFQDGLQKLEASRR